MKKLKAIIIAGGSGVGKTTLVEALLKYFLGVLHFSISVTTREKGEHEIDGKHYYFISKDRFHEMEKNDAFLETNPFVNGHRYGTLRSELEKAEAENKILVLDLEMNGAMAIYQQYPEETLIIFLDGSDKEVERRLLTGSTRKRDLIPQRIKGLQQQRALAESCPFVHLAIDTTDLKEPFVFNIAANKIQEEIAFRNSVIVGP